MPINNQKVKEAINSGKKYLEKYENGNTTYQYLWVAAQTILIRKVYYLLRGYVSSL